MFKSFKMFGAATDSQNPGAADRLECMRLIAASRLSRVNRLQNPSLEKRGKGRFVDNGGAEHEANLDHSQQTGDRGITPPERRQSSCALKRPMDELLPPLDVKRSNNLPSDDRYEETFALMPSLLQGYASIDTVSSVFLVA